MKSPADLTREWFDRVWNQQDERAIYDLLSEDAEIKGLNLAQKGPAGFAQFFQVYCANFKDIRVEITEILEKDDRVMGHALFHATYVKNQKPVDMEFSFSAQWKDGKIIEAKNVVDHHTMLLQIGALPADLLTTSLS